MQRITLTATDRLLRYSEDVVFVLCDATDGSFAVTLPDAKSSNVYEFVFLKTDSSSNTVTIYPATYQKVGTADSVSLSSQGDTSSLINSLERFWPRS